MATIKAILLEQVQATDGSYPICIRVAWGKKRKLHYTGFRSRVGNWDAKRGEVKVTHPDRLLVNVHLTSLLSEVRRRVAHFQLEGRPIDGSSLFGNPVALAETAPSFASFILGLEDHYLKRKQFIMYRKIKRLAQEIQDVLGELPPEAIGEVELRRLEDHQISRGNASSTRKRKFGFFSSFFNRVCRERRLTLPNPFKDYAIPTGKVRKERLRAAEIAALEAVELKGIYHHSRNLFLFSYYCKGVRFENCVTVRKRDIREGRILFHLVKSDKPLSVRIHPLLQALLDQYPEEREFLFPFITTLKEDLAYVKQIDSLNTRVNKHLKEVALAAGLTKKLSFHTARHSFALGMKGEVSNINKIKDALGHSRSSTTELYLEALDDEALDSEVEKLYLKKQ